MGGGDRQNAKLVIYIYGYLSGKNEIRQKQSKINP